FVVDSSPYGREVFLPALDPQRVYEITVEGVCRYKQDLGWIFADVRKKRADAVYSTDALGNFRKPHDWLTLDGTPVRRLIHGAVPEAMAREDREHHRYSLRIDGVANKIVVCCYLFWQKKVRRARGTLKITVELLPEGTPSPLAARRVAQAAREAERLRRKETEEKRAEEAAKSKKEAEVTRRELEKERERRATEAIE